MVVTMVSKKFIPLDGPRPGVVGGLLPVGSAKSPRNCGRVSTHGVREVTNHHGCRL